MSNILSRNSIWGRESVGRAGLLTGGPRLPAAPPANNKKAVICGRLTVNDETGLGLAPSDAVLDAAHVEAFVRYLDALDLQRPVGHDERPAHHSSSIPPSSIVIISGSSSSSSLLRACN